MVWYNPRLGNELVWRYWTKYLQRIKKPSLKDNLNSINLEYIFILGKLFKIVIIV